MRYISCFILLAVLFAACGTRHPEVPASYTSIDSKPSISPDYVDVVVPPNIAPLNYMIDEEGVEDCVARYSFGSTSMTFGQGKEVIVEESDWKEMLKAAKGDKITVELFAKKNGQWSKYAPFEIEVANESIDSYISYRLIPPSYSTFEQLFICQRNLETFEEKEIYNNLMLDDNVSGHCINCHAYQNYRTDRMQFHVRADHGGTVIFDKGKIKKVNLKRDETISAGVYPAWHPTLNIIAYSMNKTFQNFHTTLVNKVEVEDSQAGMMLYDVEKDKVHVICNEPDKLNAFPTWSPDGKYLYYTSAHFVYNDSLEIAQASNEDIAMQHEITRRYKDVHYDIVRRTFNADDLSFGEEEMVWIVSSENHSLTVPRVSPDGRYLLAGYGDFGVFHIWHPESDLFVADLTTLGDTLNYYPLTEANSDCAESYHNWSSNGRWIIFESRRRDNNYTRLYFSYFDSEGKAHKAFELPQKRPLYETLNLRSYNVPEFMIEGVKTTPIDLAKVIIRD